MMSDFKDVPQTDAQRPRATSRDEKPPLEVPDEAQAAQDKHGVVRYYWTERAVIEKAIHIKTGTGLMGFIVNLRLSEGREVTGFGLVNFAVYSPDADDAVRRRHLSMSERTMSIIRSLVAATGFAPEDGVLKAALLARLFPEPKALTTSPLNGKVILARVCDEPDTRPRKDGWMPPAGTRRTIVTNYEPANEE